MRKFLNFYYDNSIIFDLIIAIALVFYINFMCKYYNICINLDRDALNDLLNELISSSVSVGGFIIAALTIILTIKSNLKNKKFDKSQNGLEGLLNSRHYKTIVNIFYIASSVFVFCFFSFSLLKIFDNYIKDEYLLYFIILGMTFIISSIIRCLMVLRNIVLLQIKA
ncbi:MAG: hypothetical protein ACPG5B_11375 [Chitinophagales bacterium]